MNRTNALSVFLLNALGLLLVLPRCEAQNWVPNPSFELYDTCPSTPGFLSKPLNWNTWYWSPDYFNACAGDMGGVGTLVDVPLNGFTYQHAHIGDAYTGAFCFDPQPPDPNKGGLEYREYIGVELPCPLVVGHTYSAGFHANLASGGTYVGPIIASSHVGMLFTTSEHIWIYPTSSPFYETNYAQVYAEDMITDTVNWTLVSGTFVADSAYRYVVLGNFFENALCDTVHFNNQPTLGAYYLFDDVFVEGPPEDCDQLTMVPDRSSNSWNAWFDPQNQEVGVSVPSARNCVWELFDHSGRIWATSTIDHKVSTASVPIGIYFVRLQRNEVAGIKRIAVVR